MMRMKGFYIGAIVALLGIGLSAAAGDVNVLLVTGGCCHDYETQKVLIPKLLADTKLPLKWTVVHEGDDRDHKVSIYSSPDWIKGYDLVVHNECYGNVTDVPFVEGIALAHARTGIPAVVIHCSAHSYRNAETDEWRKLVGVTSRRHEPKRSFTVRPMLATDPIMAGFPEVWETPEDELYVVEKVWENTIPLASGTGPGSKDTYPVVWKNTYGKARVFGTTLGHGNETVTHANFSRLLANGVTWALATAGAPAAVAAPAAEAKASAFLTYDNRPMGTLTAPLVFRTYMPNPDLDAAAVLPHHAHGVPAPVYSPTNGRESSKTVNTFLGLPAAIGVNFGEALSICWDTTECRLMYAWSGGFLDMTPYWGAADNGRRRGNDYIPRLNGFLFFKAKGVHPLRINGKAVTEPHYVGWQLQDGVPAFRFQVDDRIVSFSARPGSTGQTILVDLSSSNPKDVLTYEPDQSSCEVLSKGAGRLQVLLRPNSAVAYAGFQEDNGITGAPTAAAGEKLFTALGCVACHTVDGGLGHGPTLLGVVGSVRKFADNSTAVGDDAYLLESMKVPTARTVAGFPEGLMPPYLLKPEEYQAVILYLKSLNP